MTPLQELEEISLRNGRAEWSFVATGENNELDEAARIFTLTADRQRSYVKKTLRRVNDVVVKSKDAETKPGEREVARFLRLVDLIHQVPWANKSFEPNERILRQLMCGHLELIVGQAVAKAHGNRLRKLIDPTARDSHLVWVTNRQQGKTTTMAKFLAALSIASPRGGNLVFVYSTSLDRAQEVLRAVKSIIHHLLKEKKLDALGFPNVKITRDNEIMYAISTFGTENVVRARPKNIASCRGDAPGSVMIDEIAFIEKSFFEQFVRPLTQIGGRAFTFITTPPPRDSWFQQFLDLIVEANKRGDYHFYLESHSLVCSECAEHGVPDRCTHNLGYVPRWKSLMTLHAMLALVPANERETYQTEVLGVISNKSDSYIDSRLVEALLQADRTAPPLAKEVYVAVDPASHKGAAMGMVAFSIDQKTGQKIFLGAASVPLLRAEQTQCEMTISQFMTRLRSVRALRESTILPIIECNNNEVAAHSILLSIQKFQPVRNWVSAQMFKKYITPEVGVYTTHETKAAALRKLQDILINTGELRISESFFTADNTAFTPRAPVIDPELALQNVWQEVCRFRDTDKGQISGTAGGTQKDDVGMAFLIAIYWMDAIRHHEARGKAIRL